VIRSFTCSTGRLGYIQWLRSRNGFPIPKSFQLAYPDGSKKHIGTAERDDLLLSGLAKERSPGKYAFTGQQYTFHAFAELAPLAQTFTPAHLRRFLPGSFIFEHKGKRHREMEETPGACACRLNLYENAGA
jgi:hypothetical protein